LLESIYREQFGFLRGRKIHDSIGMSHEGIGSKLLHKMDYTGQGLGKDGWGMKELIEVEHMPLHVGFNYYGGIMTEGKD
jgi:hypothetical protein